MLLHMKWERGCDGWEGEFMMGHVISKEYWMEEEGGASSTFSFMFHCPNCHRLMASSMFRSILKSYFSDSFNHSI